MLLTHFTFMKLYKTVNKKARVFIENRTLRIGSLSYYKNIESTNPGKDDSEGIPDLIITGPNITLTFDEFKEKFKTIGGSEIGIKPFKAITLNNNSGIKMISPINSLVFCASTKFLPHFGDQCFEILNIEDFAKALKDEIYKKLMDFDVDYKAIFYSHRLVGYSDEKPENIIWDLTTNVPAFKDELIFTKRKKYEKECEYRFLFAPVILEGLRIVCIPTNLEYFDIEIPNLEKLIKWIT